MTRVYFVRHALPDFTVEDDVIRPLKPEGVEDTAKVLEYLKDIKIDAFYCSPYKRSIDTISSTAEYFGMEIKIDERLREREKGERGNHTHDIIKMRWADRDFHEPGGESINMVKKRNIEALKDILAESRDKTIVIGTHGTALASIIDYYDPSFGMEGFFELIDWMPYILEMDFEGDTYIGRKKCMYVYKKFNG